MKKLLAALMTAALLGLGLVALTQAPASAANCGGKYPGCVATTTVVSTPKAKFKNGASVPISVTVLAAGNVSPTGTVSVSVFNDKGVLVYSSRQSYAGTTVTFTTQTLYHKGYYTAFGAYQPPAGSTFLPSQGATVFKIKKKHHRRHHHHHR